ncbi:unnamed protein product [Coffea canephora]|uniref:Protein kinase domain-containing protein n=1 Tax=Coffea canephora TaxID=49390 RepID=A0A068U1V3_COFCA|nr:unnamed protein product [Coffea canephora]
MNKIFIWVFLFSFFLHFHSIKPDEEELRAALSNLITGLTESAPPNQASPWNLTSYPCRDHWDGVACDNRNSLRNITLDGLKLSGNLNASFLCDVQSIAASLTVMSLKDNNLQGESLAEIANCRQLTRLYLGGNRFNGSLPDSFLRLNNLKVLDISSNNFSGTLPDLSRISGLTEFSAQNNQLSGFLPSFEFSNFHTFNVSNNNFSGPIPSGGDRFPASSFTKNDQLCGPPLPNSCPSASSDSSDKPKGGYSKDEILTFLGYFLLGLTVLLATIVFLCRRCKKAEAKVEADSRVASVDDSISKQIYAPSNFKTGPVSKSDYSTASGESAVVPSSLIVLSSPEVSGIRFENLLKAPAELLGRGKHGSVYKVFSEEMGMILAVKRIKDWTISSYDFKQRMRRLDRVKHPNILPALAFYSSNQEKLLVYEYLQHGSLFNLLHGTQMGRTFDWSTRLDVAASIADGLAFMHQELREDGIAHGNLKSSDVLLTQNMEPYISEYGLVLDSQDPSLAGSDNSYQGNGEHLNRAIFRADVYAFGVILLELLTGKLVQSDGLDLASWVVSVVREEWTVEVFDRTLIREGASEVRMVNLLQIAIKCVNRSQEARPSMNEIAAMISTLKEEEDKSMDDASALISTSIYERSP